jgi:hypothetical protein
MAAVKATTDALVDAWPIILAAGLIGGLCIAALGAMTLRLGH